MRVPGKLAQVGCGFGDVWGVALSGGVLRRTGVLPYWTPEGTGWDQLPGKLRQVSVGLLHTRSESGASGNVTSSGADAAGAGLLAEMELLHEHEDAWSAHLPEDEDQQAAWEQGA